MAHHISAEKRNRQAKKRTARNKSVKSGVRSAIKKLEQAVAAGKTEEVERLRKQAVRALDRAHSKGVLKRRTSSRKISQVTRRAAPAAAK
ncbi:MAG: 30S ribosomal protein S20 [Deltaproteobacteria bacterium]|nr:30S ribosomal protein S20 [Deltaproteobacteria bacterium]